LLIIEVAVFVVERDDEEDHAEISWLGESVRKRESGDSFT